MSNTRRSCLYCGAELEADARFCEACGRSIALPQTSPDQMAGYFSPAILDYPPVFTATANQISVKPVANKLSAQLVISMISLVLIIAGCFGIWFWYQSKPIVKNNSTLRPTPSTIIKTKTDTNNAADQYKQKLIVEPVEEDKKVVDTNSSRNDKTKIIEKKEKSITNDQAELNSAKEAYLLAYRNYTKLVTEGGEGSVEALAEYKQAYEHYKEIEQKIKSRELKKD